jgi:hypothetical protein
MIKRQWSITLNFTVDIVFCVSAGLDRGMIRECESALSALARYCFGYGDQTQPILLVVRGNGALFTTVTDT